MKWEVPRGAVVAKATMACQGRKRVDAAKATMACQGRKRVVVAKATMACQGRKRVVVAKATMACQGRKRVDAAKATMARLGCGEPTTAAKAPRSKRSDRRVQRGREPHASPRPYKTQRNKITAHPLLLLVRIILNNAKCRGQNAEC